MMQTNQLKAGAILNYIVIILNTLVGLIYTPYMLRMMGQSQYGLYSLVASVIAYLTVLDLGLGNAIVRYTAKFRAEGKIQEQYELFGMFLILYTAIGILAFIIGMGLYFNIDTLFGETMTIEELQDARIMMCIMVFNLAFTFPMTIFGSIINAYEHFVFPKVVNIVRVILNTIVMIALLHMGYKAIALVVVHTVFNVITLLLNYIYCKYHLSIKIRFAKFKWDFLREVAIYSFWIFLNVIIEKVYWSTGQFVLGAISGTVAIAVFAVAIQLHTLYIQFSTAISGVFLPKITGMVAQKKDDKEISDLFIRTGRIQNIVMPLILFGFITFGQQFIKLWAGEDYADSYQITVLFFIALYIPLIQNIGLTILQARNQMKFRCLLYLAIAAFAFILQIIMAQKWGGLGCAIAIACGLLLGHGIIMNIYYYKKQKLDIVTFWKEIMRMNIIPFCVSALFMIVNHYIQVDTSWSVFCISILAYGLVYFPLFYTYSMNSYEKDMFLSMIHIKR